MSVDKPTKPLGQKAYGSIPHLLGSRRGPADKGVNEGQNRICCEKARDKHDVIVVQEKLDGSCCSVARIGDDILALTRAGYLAETSPFEQHHVWARWVDKNRERFSALLGPGERVVGEWLAMAHGTRYELTHGPFVAFDIMRGADRATADEMARRARWVHLPTPHTLHVGGPLSVEAAMTMLGNGYHGATDPVEGAVWRVERKGKVDFLAKYVRPGKVDGCYLPEVSGKDAIWNWQEAA